MVMQVREFPASPRQFAPEISPGLEALLMRMLEKDPALRADSYDTILDEVDRLLGSPSDLNPSLNPISNPIFLTINQAWRTMRRTLDRVLGG